MTNKHAIEAVDRLLRELMRRVNPTFQDIPFGGKIIIFGGDFRQTLPVIHRGVSSNDILIYY